MTESLIHALVEIQEAEALQKARQLLERFVEAIRELQPQVLGMSGLLTLAFDSMKQTVRAIEEAALREKVRIMIGGGQVTEQVKDYTGADAYGEDALVGVRLVKQWIGGE